MGNNINTYNFSSNTLVLDIHQKKQQRMAKEEDKQKSQRVLSIT